MDDEDDRREDEEGVRGLTKSPSVYYIRNYKKILRKSTKTLPISFNNLNNEITV